MDMESSKNTALKEVPSSNYSKGSELKGLIMIALCQILWGIDSVFIKLTKNIFLGEMSPFLLSLGRGITTLIVTVFLMHKYVIPDINVFKLKNKFWFATLTVGNFFIAVFLTSAIMRLRSSTAVSMMASAPLLMIILAIFLLKESFKPIYILGFILCFTGTLLIVSNEKGIQNNEIQGTGQFVLGVFYGICAMVFFAFAFTSMKFIVNENLHILIVLKYIGLSNTLLSAIACILIRDVNFSFTILLWCCIDGFFFLLGSYLSYTGMKYVDVSKSSPLTYLEVVTTFVFGALLFGEPVFFTDIIGSLMIIGYNSYTAYTSKN